MFKHISNYKGVLPALKRKNEGGHRVYYDENKNKYHSVTNVVGSIDQKGLDEWREKVGKDVADYVAIRSGITGTKLHKIVESHLANKKPEEDNIFARAHFTNMEPLLANIDLINGLETKLCSRELGLAGTVDCIAQYKGVDSIIDFKTSTKERSDDWNENYYIQCSAYAEMFTELSEIDTDQIVILVVTENGTVQEFIKKKRSTKISIWKR